MRALALILLLLPAVGFANSKSKAPHSQRRPGCFEALINSFFSNPDEWLESISYSMKEGDSLAVSLTILGTLSDYERLKESFAHFGARFVGGTADRYETPYEMFPSVVKKGEQDGLGVLTVRMDKSSLVRMLQQEPPPLGMIVRLLPLRQFGENKNGILSGDRSLKERLTSGPDNDPAESTKWVEELRRLIAERDPARTEFVIKIRALVNIDEASFDHLVAELDIEPGVELENIWFDRERAVGSFELEGALPRLKRVVESHPDIHSFRLRGVR